MIDSGGRPAVEELGGEPVEHRGPDHLLAEVARGEHRDRGEAVAHLLELLALALAPLAEVAAGELLGEDRG